MSAANILQRILLSSLLAASSAMAQSHVQATLDAEAGAHGRKLVLKIERFHSCEKCAAYELHLFDDGTYLYTGKDAVRRLGASGTAGVRAAERRSGDDYLFASEDALARNAKTKLEQLTASLRSIVEFNDSMVNLARREAALAPTQALPWKTEIEFRSGSGAIESVTFYDGLTPKSTLGYIASWANDAFGVASDVIAMPPVLHDANVLLRWSLLWPDRVREASCPGDKVEMVAYLYRDGRLLVYSQRRRSFLASRLDAGSATLGYPLEAHAYEKSITRLSGADIKGISQLMAINLEATIAQFEARRRPEDEMSSRRPASSPRIDLFLRNQTGLASFEHISRRGYLSTPLGKKLDDLVIRIENIARVEVGDDEHFRCGNRVIRY